MNQILSFQTSANGRKIIRNNLKHLCILLIIFALIMISEGGWRLYTNLNKKVNVDKPILIGHRNLNKTVFNIKANNGVQKITYKWISDEETIINEETAIERSGEKETSFEIDNRIGVNYLSIKIIDSIGNTIIYNDVKIVYDEEEIINPINEQDPPSDQSWEEAVTNDNVNPTVELSTEKGKVVINARDNVKMSYVTYKWNDGEETKITGLSEDEKSVIASIDAMRGDNVLKIKAVDKAGNIKEFEKEVHGTDGPQISVKKDQEAGKIIANITDEYGITKIEYNFNNENKTIDNIEGTSYKLEFDLIDGDNFVIIHAYEGNVKSEYKGKTTK